MAIIDGRGFVDDGTGNIDVAGTVTVEGSISYSGYASAQKVSDWYIDWVSGSDNNSGTSLSSPLKTFMGGLVTKWGTSSPVLSQSTSVHVLSSQPVGAEIIILEPTMGGPFNFYVLGSLLSSSAQVLNVVQQKNRTTNAQFLSNGFLSSSTAGQLVVNTTSGKSSSCFIRTFSTGVAQLTQPLAPMAPGDNVYNPAPAEVDTWAHGDTVSVYDLPAINLQTINVKAGTSIDSSTNPVLWLQHLKLLDAGGTIGDSVFAPTCQNGYVNMTECYIQPYTAFRYTGYFTDIVNCVNNGLELSQGGWVIGGMGTTYATLAFSPCYIDGDYIADQGIFASGPEVILGYVNVASQLKVHPNSTARINVNAYSAAVVWGQGNIDVEPLGMVWNSTGQTWASTVKVPTLTLDAVSTATTYATGTWHDSVAITAANIDFYGGMQNPKTGARYF